MRSLLSNTTFLLFFLFAATKTASAQCFFPNSTAVQSRDYAPCPNSNTCCALNRPNPSGGPSSAGYTADTCFSNGLCANTVTNADKKKVTTYWRDFCASKNWTDGSCVSACIGPGEMKADGTAEMTPCGDAATATRWCCGGGNTKCCDASNSNAKPVVLPVSVNSTSTSSTTSTPSQSSTPNPSQLSASSTPQTPLTTNGGLSTAEKAGIGIGATLGFFAILGLGVFLMLYARRGRNTDPPNVPELSGTMFVEAPSYNTVSPTTEIGGSAISEMSEEGIRWDQKIHYKRETNGIVRYPPVELP